MWTVHKFLEDPTEFVDKVIDPNVPLVEPYYDGSPISELGWEMQHAVSPHLVNAFLFR